MPWGRTTGGSLDGSDYSVVELQSTQPDFVDAAGTFRPRPVHFSPTSRARLPLAPVPVRKRIASMDSPGRHGAIFTLAREKGLQLFEKYPLRFLAPEVRNPFGRNSHLISLQPRRISAIRGQISSA
jgi:hypothetical protein